MKLERLITLYTAVMNLGELVKRLNLSFRVVVAGEILFLYSCWKSNQLAFVAGAQKGRGGGGGGGELATEVRASVTVIWESPFPKL